MSFLIAFIVFGLWTIYRFIFPENLLVDEVVFKPLIWLLPVFLVTGFKTINFKIKNNFQNISFGFIVGLIFSLERILTNHQLTASFSFLVIVTALFTAITEEIFFRGYLLNQWLIIFKRNIWLAMLLNGIFFTITHLPLAVFKFHYAGNYLLSYCLSNFISGFVDIILFVATGSIFAPIANHFVWNVFSGIFR